MNIRKIALRVLEKLAFDIRIRNPWSGNVLHLNTFMHKSYWFYGRRREQSVMKAFERLISKQDVVIEVGGHIGYLSQYFSSLVGQQGRVIVFEPGSNNIPYIVKNTEGLPNVDLLLKGVSNFSGTAIFYEENITGQTNSLDGNFSGAEAVAKSHYREAEKIQNKISVTTLDDYIQSAKILPNFLKIDVEGCDLKVLQGASECLKSCRALMVEATEDREAIVQELKNAGFQVLNEDFTEFSKNSCSENLLAIRPER